MPDRHGHLEVTAAGVAAAAALAVALAIGLYQSLTSSPWISKDERAHTGYIMSLTHGRLPTITTPIETPDGAFDLEGSMAFEGAVRERDAEARRDRVWVANHPPGAYLPVVPLARVFAAEGHGRSVLLVQRLNNVVGAVAAIGFTALLARQMTGRAPVGALAAGLCAVTPYLMASASFGLTDGPGLAASMGVVWAATRACSRGWDSRSTALVAAFSVVCGLTRLTSLATAAAVVAVALIVTGARQRRLLWRQALAVSVPVVGLSGWFYALNTRRYGDPAASEYLLDRFGRAPSGSISAVATDLSIWDHMLRTLLAARRDSSFSDVSMSNVPAPSSLISSAALAVVAASSIALVIRLWRQRGAEPHTFGALRAEPVGWLLLLTAVVVGWLTTAQHISGGGNPHARYGLIFVPAAACVVASSADAAGRWLAGRAPSSRAWTIVGTAAALLPVVALAWYCAVGLDGFASRTIRPAGFFSTGTRLGPDWARSSALVAATVAGLAYLAVMAAAWRRSADVGGHEVGLVLAADDQPRDAVGHENDGGAS